MGGSKFGLRANALSTKENKILDAIDFTHKSGKRFYLTVNTLFKDTDIDELYSYLDDIVEAKVDAFIVQDLGIGELLKKRYSGVELHASTQMNITSSKSIKLLRDLGYKKVVMARELSLGEIKNIKREVGDSILLEAFIHGSMCYSYSGTCLMSSFIGGESGNRGRCKGPCRLPYRSQHLRNSEKYILSMKDMCTLKNISDMIEAGISSFKIEGRMRQSDYVAGVTKTYRKYIDDYIKSKNEINVNKKVNEAIGSKILSDEKYLNSLYNKGGFTNYLLEHNSRDMIQIYER